MNPALTFHGIGTPPGPVPDAERPYWIAPDHFAEVLDEVAAATAAGVPVTLTFDDGNRSDLDIALPMLAERGLRAVFFACAGRLGQAHYLSAADLRALAAAGMGVGSHGMDHVDWRGCSPQALLRETRDAKARLEEALRGPVTEAAIPFGSYDARVLAALRQAGFRTVWSSDRLPADARAHPRPRRTVAAADRGRPVLPELLAAGPLARAKQGLKIRLKARR